MSFCRRGHPWKLVRRTGFQLLQQAKKFFRRTAVSYANPSGHVNPTPPDDADCNLASSGALFGVSGYRPETISAAVLDRPRRIPNRFDRCYQ